MRTIKFRGKRLKDGKWIFGNLADYSMKVFNTTIEKKIIFGNIVSFATDNFGFVVDDCAVDPDTIGQFTGLLDKNGKEIYEGDIITVNGLYPRVVLWDKMTWALMPAEYYHDKYFWVMNLQHPDLDWWEQFADEFEIIGNIYDNPELLKGSPK